MPASINNLIGTLYEAFTGQPELLDAVLTEDWDNIPLGPDQEPGRAGARALIEWLSKAFRDRKSTRLNSSHITRSRMPSSA